MRRTLRQAQEAIHDRRPGRGGLVHHSDGGSRYPPIKSPNVLRRPAHGLPSAASATAATTPSRKRSAASIKRRSSVGAGRGGALKPSGSRRWNGRTGSTTAGRRSPSATARRPKPRNDTAPRWNSWPWRRDSNEMASGKPEAVQYCPVHLPTLRHAHLEISYECELFESAVIRSIFYDSNGSFGRACEKSVHRRMYRYGQARHLACIAMPKHARN